MQEVGLPSRCTLGSPWHTEVVLLSSWIAHCFSPLGEVHTQRNQGMSELQVSHIDSPSRIMVVLFGALFTMSIASLVPNITESTKAGCRKVDMSAQARSCLKQEAVQS